MMRVRPVYFAIAVLVVAGLVAAWLLVRGPGRAVRLLEVNAPNGVETVNGKPFFWAGGGRTVVKLESPRAGNTELSFIPTLGPSLPGVPRRHLLITAAGGFSRVLTIEAAPRVTFAVPVVTGVNEIGLIPLDVPTVAAQPNGDRRQLLLGVGDLAASDTSSPPLTGEPCYAVLTSGWEPLERSGADWLRWTAGRGDLLVVVPAATTVVLEGEIVAMIRPNAVDVRLNERSIARWSLEGQGFGAITIPSAEIGLRQGQNLLSFVSAARAVSTPADPRPLAIAVRNLQLRIRSAAGPCTMQR